MTTYTPFAPARPLPPDLLINRLVFESSLVSVAIFRAGVGHPGFRDPGEIPTHLFAFPRHAIRIHVEGESPYVADPGTVAFYNAKQVFRRAPVDPAGDICDIFAVSRDVVVDLVADRDVRAVDRVDRPFPFTHGPSRPEAYVLQRQLLRHIQATASPDRLAVQEGTLRLLGSIVDSAAARSGEIRAPRPPTAAESELAEAVRDHLVRSYRHNESLEEIGATLDRSVYYLCRAFRRHLGTTIHEFRQQLRLRRSLDLVAQASSDISGVALHLGFSSHSHFTATFRRTFGITPSEFRRVPGTRCLRELITRAGAAWRGHPRRARS